MNKLSMLALLILLTSCASYKDVKVLDLKSKTCEIINKTKGLNDFGSEQAAVKALRQKALEMGGNAVYVDDIIVNGKNYEAHGYVYKCD